MLIARIESREQEFATDSEIFAVRFVLENPDNQDYFVLKWFTPLEGFASDCLQVYRDGQVVPYDGRVTKRGTPGPDDYVRIRAGESVSVDVDLHEAFHVSDPGTYVVTTVLDAVDYFPVPEDLLVHPSSALGRGQFGKEMRVSEAAFTVSESDRAKATRRLTAGEAVRQQEASRGMAKLGPAPSAKVGALEPQFVGGSATEKVETRQAHFDGYALCVAASAALANDPWYAEWFGQHTASRFSTVQGNYTSIRTAMETKTFTYDLTGTGCQSNWYAYTYKGATTIWPCGLFWKAPAHGTDSKAGTVLHEHSHASARTDDIVYGQGPARTLAKSDPDKAIRNADNYEYFGRG
jgi:hypothetical protein